MTNYNIEVADPINAEIGSFLRPYTRIDSNGRTQVKTNSKGNVFLRNPETGLLTMSSLRKDEWEELDSTVFKAARQSQVILNDLRSKGLVKPVPFEAVVSQWNKSSEVTAAQESLMGEGGGNRGQVDYKLSGVPVPVIFKDFNIPRRALLASRKMGSGLDFDTAFESAMAVSERREQIIIDGSTLRLGSSILYGLTNHTDLLTDTAANYGGGDWGTAANITPTITGMINAVSAITNRFSGPYHVYIARTQYNQAALSFPSSDNNSTYIDRILSIASIDKVSVADFLADGEVLIVQMTQNVIDYVEAYDVQLVEWASGDGMTSQFKIMAVGAPRIKSDYAGRIGAVLATGA